MFHKLELLDQTRTDLRVRVRVTRMWPSISSNGTFMGFNLIILDAENYHVHAFVYPAVWNVFENVILEGNLYEIANFETREATGRLRPVSSKLSIILTHLSIVQPVVHDAITIPMHKFELVDFGEMHNLIRSYTADDAPSNAIDIAGVVENIEPIKTIHTDSGDMQFVRFHIYDGSNSVKVTLWNEKIASLDPLFEENFDAPPIVILATMQTRRIHGEIQVSSLSHSRIYINLDYEDVIRIRQRLHQQGYEAHVHSP